MNVQRNDGPIESLKRSLKGTDTLEDTSVSVIRPGHWKHVNALTRCSNCGSCTRGKSEFQQQRAVTGRMIADIEMNDTVRGAVALFSLCTNLHKYDALFAECIRSFPTITVDAQTWLHRLEVEI